MGSKARQGGLSRALIVGCMALSAGEAAGAAEGAAATPFKLGTFQVGSKEFLGLVLQDDRVLEIGAANAAFERRNARAAKVRMPGDMNELIARYEQDVGPRLRQIAAASVGAAGAAYSRALSGVRILPPMRPAVILNAGANYPEHAQGIVAQAARAAAAAGQGAEGQGSEGAGAERPGAERAGAERPGTERAGTEREAAQKQAADAQPADRQAADRQAADRQAADRQAADRRAGAAPAGPAGAADRRPRVGSAPGLWEHPESDNRPDNPYLFLKSPSVVVGADDDVVVPRGRDQIDWECEFAVVVGRPAKNVSVADAASYIFGYSIEFDVSDRGGRNDRKMGGGPDWFIQKNHDTFAPIGPFIVPKEFVPSPMNTRHYFTLNGEIKQDANTSRMEYNIWEMLSYASNVLTLHPGDLISMGTPPGTNIEKSDPRWMRAGDVGVCVVEGVGEQHHHIVAQK